MKTKMHLVIGVCILSLGTISLACGSTGQISSTPMVVTASVGIPPSQNVVVSKPTDQEMEDLLTLSRLPAGSCSEMQDEKTCSIAMGQAIKWGWGFCEDDPETLEAKLSTARVELLVDGSDVPEALIYQRDEVYDRSENAYCHVWMVKLSNWRSGATVRLENRASFSSLDSTSNVFVIQVE